MSQLDMRAAFMQKAGHCKSNALRTTRHNCDLTFQHMCLPLLVTPTAAW